MELIFEKKNKRTGDITSGILRGYIADFDVSEEDISTFEVKMALPSARDDLLFIEGEVETVLFVEGTEYGGIIDGSTLDLENKEVTYTGRTWRGTLGDYIVEPGKDVYRYVSGSGAAVMRSLPHHPLITFTGSGVTVPRTKLERWCTTHEAAKAIMAAAKSACLEFRYEANANGRDGGQVICEVRKKRDLRNDIAFSQDYGDRVAVKITRDGTTPRRLICLGPEGDDGRQTALILYADKNWNVTKTPISGSYPQDTHEVSDDADLEEEGRKRFAELIEAHTSVEVTVSDIDLMIGDIISAKDNLTGEEVSASISGIVWKREDYGGHAVETVEYRTSSGTII